MKLQYLGDSRDSFKWDMLHFLVIEGGFSCLTFIPFLTPDDPHPTDGRTPAHLFPCRPEILSFGAQLRSSRNLKHVERLGHFDADRAFDVQVYQPKRFVGEGQTRTEYLAELHSESLTRSLIFFDPDNGFETKTQRGEKWVRHEEIAETLDRLPQNAAIAVYQHRPRRRWSDVLPELRKKCHYAPCFLVIYESSLAFVLLSKDTRIHRMLVDAAEKYVDTISGSRVAVFKTK